MTPFSDVNAIPYVIKNLSIFNRIAARDPCCVTMIYYSINTLFVGVACQGPIMWNSDTIIQCDDQIDS